MSDVFFCVGGKKNLDVFFSAKKAQNERWEVVWGPSTLRTVVGLSLVGVTTLEFGLYIAGSRRVTAV